MEDHISIREVNSSFYKKSENPTQRQISHRVKSSFKNLPRLHYKVTYIDS